MSTSSARALADPVASGAREQIPEQRLSLQLGHEAGVPTEPEGEALSALPDPSRGLRRVPCRKGATKMRLQAPGLGWPKPHLAAVGACSVQVLQNGGGASCTSCPAVQLSWATCFPTAGS